MTKLRPLTDTGLCEVHDDPGERLCHIVGEDGGWLCRQERDDPAPESTARTHITRRPGEAVCDGCGLPRCPRCKAIWQREEREVA